MYLPAKKPPTTRTLLPVLAQIPLMFFYTDLIWSIAPSTVLGSLVVSIEVPATAVKRR